VALSSKAAPAVIGAVTLSTLLEGTTEMGIEVSAGFHVGPDVQIDGFVADLLEGSPASDSPGPARGSSRVEATTPPGRSPEM